MEGDVITLQDLFLFDHAMGFDETGRSLGTLRSTGISPAVRREAVQARHHDPAGPVHLRAVRRLTVLLWIGLAAIFVGLALPARPRASSASGTPRCSAGCRSTPSAAGSRAPAERATLNRANVARSAVELAGRRRWPAATRRSGWLGRWTPPDCRSSRRSGRCCTSGIALGSRAARADHHRRAACWPRWPGSSSARSGRGSSSATRQSSRRTAFYEQLPDTLQLVAGSLSAGYSMPQALDTVVREGNQPMAARVLPRTGRDPARRPARGRAGHRRRPDAVPGLPLGRDGGAHPARRGRQPRRGARHRRGHAARTRPAPPAGAGALGRGSALGLVISLLPVVFIIVALVARPDYLKPLYTTALGALMLVTASVLFIVGIFWLRRVTRVEV